MNRDKKGLLILTGLFLVVVGCVVIFLPGFINKTERESFGLKSPKLNPTSKVPTQIETPNAQQNVDKKLLLSYKLPTGWTVKEESKTTLLVSNGVVDLAVGIITPGVYGCKSEIVTTDVGDWSRQVEYNSAFQDDLTCTNKTSKLVGLSYTKSLPVTVSANFEKSNLQKGYVDTTKFLADADSFVLSLEINPKFFE